MCLDHLPVCARYGCLRQLSLDERSHPSCARRGIRLPAIRSQLHRRPYSFSFVYSSYSCADIRSPVSFLSRRRMRTIQAWPYGSSLIFSGALPSSAFTSTTSPETGMNNSETAFTDSTLPKVSPESN